MKIQPAIVAISIAAPFCVSRADDTDIYFAGGGSVGGKPLVMFSLDYRPNLGATVCQGSGEEDDDEHHDESGAQSGDDLGGDDEHEDDDHEHGDDCRSLRTTVSPSSGTTYLPSSGDVTHFDLIRAALRKTMDDLGTELADVKVGLMINHNDSTTGQCGAGPSGQCSNGAYVLRGFSTDKARFHDALARIPVPQGNLAHDFQGKELYFELFRYLTGQGIFNGHKGWQDYGDTNANDNLDVDNPGTPFDDTLLQWDGTIENGANYVSPLADNCSKVFMINFMFQVSNKDNDSDSSIRQSKGSGGMNGLNPGTSNSAFANVIRWMRDADLADGTYGSAGNLEDVQNVTSYFFVAPTHINTTTNSYATAGGTNAALPLSTDPELLIASLKEVFKEVLSVSATFVSAASPVNVFNRTESLNHVFFSIFQPEQAPRWNGNLKRLKLASDPTTHRLKVLDASSPPIEAISSVDGRIKHEALTYWTGASGFDVQTYADTTKGEVVGKDGRSVGRGGGGQRIPGFLTNSPGDGNSTSGARKLYTEPDSLSNGSATALRALNADSTTATAVWSTLRLNGAKSGDAWSDAATFGAATSDDQATAVKLLKFARGQDANDEDGDGNYTEAHPWASPANQLKRKWLMADPLHSAAVPLNYGARTGYSRDVQDVRILVSGNDGFLHMFRNSASGSSTTESPSGVEDWAFIPRRLLGNLKPLSDNGAATSHVYGLDGTVAVYVNDMDRDGTVNGSDQVIAFVGMRRGGKGYYALDITNPDSPKMLWTIEKNDASGNFDELGYSFSDPTIAQLDWGEGRKPVIIFGGGYSTNKDESSTANARNGAAGTDDTQGNAIYIVNAKTGALIWKAKQGSSAASATTFQHSGLADSIPSKVTAVDTDENGSVDRLYVGDTGGVLWRADLAYVKQDGTTSYNEPAHWTVTPVLSVGRHAGQPDRRFFHRPDFVPTSAGSSRFDAILIGSGDREHPLDTNVQNQFYMFKDTHVASGSPPTGSAKTVTDLDNLTSSTTVHTDKSGWYIDIGSSASGEKVLSSPLTYNGSVYFGTYAPQGGSVSGQCGPNEGESLTYVVRLADASGVFNFNTATAANERFTATGRGLPSDPVTVAVNGKLYVTAGNLPANSDLSKPVGNSGISRLYWYEKE
ncbi:pilus assembly protein [Methylococcus mesophilus]|uniref:pilus assembly protein n=1 Tax=Methylococcus mesophilus TaxID=2993564 RepID=UPI00224B41DB|nr:PilC/PilY family type IV pilus protein [Methylococcus mesophilus]UZR27528.1 PilC/PilY family type IV pilus protein [Methylococcus mesophilus]